ncbi:MAG: transporter substrate-binding domain-containing protein [Desulfovibrionales bacterium]
MVSNKWVLVLLFVVGCLLPRGYADDDVLRIATEGSYPPFSYLNSHGELAGFDVDLAHALCQAMNRSCEITHRAWDDLIPGLANREYDAIIACMAATAQRETMVDFTDHYLRSKSGFIGKAGTSGNLSPQALRRHTLASQKGTAQMAYLQRKYGTSRVKEFDTMLQAYQALARGEVDLVLSPNLAAYDFLRSPAGVGFDFVGETLSNEEYPHSPAHIAVRKGDDTLKRQINNALQDIRINGVYDRINRKYFPFSIY